MGWSRSTRLAVKSCLSSKVLENSLVVVDNLPLKDIKTKIIVTSNEELNIKEEINKYCHTFFDNEHGCFIKGQSRMQQSDMLLLHDKHTLTDFHKYVRMARKASVADPERAEKSIEEHKNILQAIKSRNADEAEKLANIHMMNVMKN